MPHRAAFSEVVLERDDADIEGRVLGGESEREGGGAVLGAVVDDEEFVRAFAGFLGGGWGRGDGCGCAEVCEGGVEHGGETVGLIVSGDDDAQIERALVGERGEREGRRWGCVRAVGLFRQARHDRGRREENER